MPESVRNPAVLVMALTVFVAVLLLLEAVYLLWAARYGAQARRLHQRLQALASEREQAREAVLRRAFEAERPWLERGLRRLPASRRIERFVQQARLPWGATRLALLSVVLALLVALLADVVVPVSGGLLLAGAGMAAALPWLYVAHRRRTRLGALQQQLPDALDLMARALKAGHAFSSALQMVGDEMAEPIGSEFRLVHDEVNFGMGLPQAFAHLTERVPLSDLRYFVVAVIIQREAGGNLTELLGSLAQLIRARLKLLARVRVLSSEGRLSAWVLVLLPFVLAGLLAVFNPEFIRPLWTDPIGLNLLHWMAAMMLVGLLMIRKIVRIRV